MKLANVVRINEDGTVKILETMKALVGFEDGARVFFHLVESHYTKLKNGKKDKKCELKVIVFSVDPRCWDRLYNIKLNLGDQPDSLADVANLLEKAGISVQWAESYTTLCNVKAEWALTIWLKNFKGDIDALNNFLEKEISKNKALRASQRPVVVSYDKETWTKGELLDLQLYASVRTFRPGRAGEPGKDVPIHIPHDQQATEIRKDRLLLPDFIIDKLNGHFGLPRERYKSVAGNCYAIVIADSDEKTLTLDFLPPERRIIEAEFFTQDDPGAISNIATVLKGARVNLLKTKYATLGFADTGLWTIIADISDSEYRGCKASELKEVMEKDIKKTKSRLFKRIGDLNILGARPRVLTSVKLSIRRLVANLSKSRTSKKK